MKTIKLANASRSLGEYAVALADEILVVTDHNKPVAAIVPLKGVDVESIALSAHPAFLRIIGQSRREFRRGQTLSLAEMKAAFRQSPNQALQPTSRARRKASVKRRSRAARG